ncbi:hypothetical protein PT974_02107 [Cladobotryum mycophilum]|uniref:Uncharacterized protein n=1 Tax=Cladobotryum mycophilum TaxID=491253 RepID=A0ABR0SYE3_9HYPO
MATDVRMGAWTNHIKGPVLGLTLMLSVRDGQYLIAFLAMFVRTVGSHFWRLTAYLLFQARSRGRCEDGLHHQHQAILRNVSSATTAMSSFLELGWAWRSKVPRPCARTVGFMLWGLFQILAFSAAGIFSSRIATTMESEVLLSPSSACGQFSPKGNFAAAQAAHVHYKLSRISRYFMPCHGGPTTWPCMPLGRKPMNWTTMIDSSCPFAVGMCAGDVAVQFDIGLMDSLLHLGINAGPDRRAQYRRTMSCAPITTNNYVSTWLNAGAVGANLPEYSPTKDSVKKFLTLSYGPNLSSGREQTVIFDRDMFKDLVNVVDVPQIRLASAVSKLNSSESTWKPIDQLARTDADVTLLFLFNNAHYSEPVYDPWFHATDRNDDGDCW